MAAELVPYLAYHVSSSRNRPSILRHGLDWRLKGTDPGIAGSEGPEQACVFLVRDLEEADFFVWMGLTRLPEVDIWEVTLEHDPDAAGGPYGEIDGFLYTTQTIPAERVRLLRSETEAPEFS